jgi:C4-dicarboxylate transporter DctM subunit
MAAFGLIVIIVLALLLGQPLYVLIGSVAIYCLLVWHVPVLSVHDLDSPVLEATRGLFDNPVLLAIPFFIVAGGIMTEGDIAKRLIAFARAIFGWVPGGLAVAAICACIFFAAISGSSPVTVIAIGSIMYPALLQERYPDKFANGLVTSAGSLGILIPPSVPMIVYAIVEPTKFRAPCGYELGSGGELDVGDLFLAGVGPGILIGLALSAYAIYIGVKHKLPRTALDWGQVWHSLREGVWALLMPIIVLGGIYSALFSPTQAAAVSVVYALVVEFWIHKSIKVEDLPRIMSRCAVLMGTLLLIMTMALAFNEFLADAMIPEAAVEMIKGWDLSLVGFLLIVNVLLLIVGCLMDIISAILILVPMLSLIGAGVGVHPMHLAVIFIVNLEIGYLTPPVGLNLFVSSTIFKKPLGVVIKAVVPFLLIMLGCLMLITYVPTISLGLVSIFRDKPPTVTFPSEETRKACAAEGKEVKSEIEQLMDDLNVLDEEDEGGAPDPLDEGEGKEGGDPGLLDDSAGGEGGAPGLLDGEPKGGEQGGDPDLLDNGGGGDPGLLD